MGRPEIRPGSRGKTSFTPVGRNVEASFYYRDTHGTRKRMKARGRTKTEAAEELEYRWSTRDESDADAAVTGSTTIAELGQIWIKSLRGKAPGTVETYRNRVRISVDPYIGNKKVRDVTTGYIEAHLRRIADGGETKAIQSKSGTRLISTGGLTAENTARVVLRGMFDLAVSFNAVPSRVNPVGKDKRSKERRGKRKDVRAPTKQEYLELRRRILAWQSAQRFGPPRGRDLVPCVDVMLGVGVRPNEMLAIRWEDLWLDADIPFILVTGTIAKDDDDRWHRQDWTKGDRDQVAKIQPIALPDYVVNLFKERKAGMGGTARGLVFTDRKSEIRLISNFRRSLREAREYDNQSDDDSSWMTPKSFRKSTATMIKKSAGLEAAAEQLRHSSSAVTREFYIQEELQMIDNRAVFEDVFPAGTDQ
ncbi:tyrosine-type recombinase/integrase [Pseudarthrobacter sp. ATCC 49987]|uniref:tyrosine-type recombinase/integrase n=1 Tax=Pseudarthrobacter sp. ATCC 49987 TaxID=2698204 RepID=UPI001368AF7B|nr:tyrosine-type recombinase/integrase [Pseudarthrobacter sp. ATCC 49987]